MKDTRFALAVGSIKFIRGLRAPVSHCIPRLENVPEFDVVCQLSIN